MIKSLLPLFSRQSSIILNGSVSALIGHRHSAAYGASKEGLTALASGLSYELQDRGIRVNGIGPGPIVTNALKGLGPNVEAALYEEICTPGSDQKEWPSSRNCQSCRLPCLG